MLKYLAIIILLILSLKTVVYAGEMENSQQNINVTSFERKNPFLAGIFSWYHPGLGQFYAGSVSKGTLFWLTENILLFTVILNIADIKFSIKRDFGFEFRIKLKDNPSNLRIATTIGLSILLIAIHIYNIIDAIKTAQLYNQKMFAREFELSRRNFSVEGYAYNDVSGLKLVQRF